MESDVESLGVSATPGVPSVPIANIGRPPPLDVEWKLKDAKLNGGRPKAGLLDDFTHEAKGIPASLIELDAGET